MPGTKACEPSPQQRSCSGRAAYDVSPSEQMPVPD